MNPLVWAAGAAVGMSGEPNLVSNPSFEEIPGPVFGEGVLPDGWINLYVTADTYSEQGDFGLALGDFGNFPSELGAPDGERFVAAWYYGVTNYEDLGGPLVGALEPGRVYRMSAQLTQSIRTGQDVPGTYVVSLAVEGGLGASRAVGSFGPTVSAEEGWVARGFKFIAPEEAGLFPWIVLSPRPLVPESGVCCPYPGLDGLELVASSCIADTTADGLLNTDDFVAFLGAFANGQMHADIADSGGGTCAVFPDGIVNTDDFVCYLVSYGAGCP